MTLRWWVNILVPPSLGVYSLEFSETLALSSGFDQEVTS